MTQPTERTIEKQLVDLASTLRWTTTSWAVLFAMLIVRGALELRSSDPGFHPWGLCFVTSCSMIGGLFHLQSRTISILVEMSKALK